MEGESMINVQLSVLPSLSQSVGLLFDPLDRLLQPKQDTLRFDLCSRFVAMYVVVFWCV